MKDLPNGHKALLDAEDRLYARLKGRLLNKRRMELDMTQQEVADGAGISRTEMHNIEHGLTNEGTLTLRRICKALRMSYGALVIQLDYLMDHPEDQKMIERLKSRRGKKVSRPL